MISLLGMHGPYNKAGHDNLVNKTELILYSELYSLVTVISRRCTRVTKHLLYRAFQLKKTFNIKPGGLNLLIIK